MNFSINPATTNPEDGEIDSHSDGASIEILKNDTSDGADEMLEFDDGDFIDVSAADLENKVQETALDLRSFINFGPSILFLVFLVCVFRYAMVVRSDVVQLSNKIDKLEQEIFLLSNSVSCSTEKTNICPGDHKIGDSNFQTSSKTVGLELNDELRLLFRSLEKEIEELKAVNYAKNKLTSFNSESKIKTKTDWYHAKLKKKRK